MLTFPNIKSARTFVKWSSTGALFALADESKVAPLRHVVARRKRRLVGLEAEVIDAVRMNANEQEWTLANCCSKRECPPAAILLVWQGFDNPNR